MRTQAKLLPQMQTVFFSETVKAN